MTQNVFENLIANYPLLDRLTPMNFDGFDHLNINVSNLQILYIRAIYDEVMFENTIKLTLVCIGVCVNVKNNRNLVGGSNKLLRFIESLPHIRRLPSGNDGLTLVSYCYMCLRSRFNYELLFATVFVYWLYTIAKTMFGSKLTFYTHNFNDYDESLATLCLLRSSPCVQELEIFISFFSILL